MGRKFTEHGSLSVQNPLDQFTIKTILPIHVMGVDLSVTNSTLFLFMITAVLLFFQWSSLTKGSLVPSRLQCLYEMCYEFIADLIKDSAGKEGMAYMPGIFSLFLFILTANLFGMLPYGFTVTSHIAITLGLSLSLFIFLTFLGLFKQGWGFFKLFYPSGVPLVLAPIIVPAEIVIYCIRPLTLAIRLFANMMAGHIVLKLFAFFTVSMGLWGFFPFVFVILLTGFEFFIAVLQAYIFTVLACIYLNDALHGH